MKLQFTNPCPSGESLGGSFLNKSKIKYNTKKGDSILCPYDGEVTKYSKDSITITHNISKEEWESELSGFYPDVSLNQNVHAGRQIGHSKDGVFTFEVSPSVNLEDLLSYGIDSSNYHGKSENKKNKKDSMDDSHTALNNIMLSPFAFIRGALNLNKSKDLNEQEIEEKTKLIKEDINRMKKLL